MTDTREDRREEETVDPDDDTPESARAQTPAAQPAAKDDKKKDDDKPRKRGRPAGPLPRMGETGEAAKIPAGVDRPHEAHMIWLDVIHRFTGEGIEPHEMIIHVARTSPGERFELGSIEASSVMGDDDHNAADVLRNAIIDQFHITQQGAATYDVAFVWKRGHTWYDRGKLRLPSIREIAAFRHAAIARQGQQPNTPYLPPVPGVGHPQGFGGPPPQHQPAPYFPYFPSGYGAPPPPQQEGELAQVLREMRAENARLAARVEQLATQRQAVPAPAAPAPQGLGLEAITQVANVLKPFGLTIQRLDGGPAPLPPPPQAPIPPAVAPKTDEEALSELLSRMERQSDLKDRVAAAFGLKKDEPSEDEEKDEEEKPGLGFHVHEIPGATWPDGSKMHHATDEKQNWSLGGLILSNPYIIDKFGGGLIDLAKRFVPAGLGQPREQPPQQQQSVPQRPRNLPRPPPIPPEPEVPNGAGKTDWDL